MWIYFITVPPYKEPIPSQRRNKKVTERNVTTRGIIGGISEVHAILELHTKLKTVVY